MYQIFSSRVQPFEVSFKYLSNFIAPPVAAYGSFIYSHLNSDHVSLLIYESWRIETG